MVASNKYEFKIYLYYCKNVFVTDYHCAHSCICRVSKANPQEQFIANPFYQEKTTALNDELSHLCQYRKSFAKIRLLTLGSLMKITADELRPFFAKTTALARLQKLAELIEAESLSYYEQREMLNEDNDVDDAIKNIKAIMKVKTDCETDYERYAQNIPDTDEFREQFLVLTKPKLVKAVQQAIHNILRNSGNLTKAKNNRDYEVSIDGFLEQRKKQAENPQPYIQFLTFVLLRCQLLELTPTSEKKICSYLIRVKLQEIKGYKTTNDDETTNDYLKQAKKRIKDNLKKPNNNS